MTAKIIQFPHVLEAEHRIQLQEELIEATKRDQIQHFKACVRQMVENHDGYFVDLFLKLIDQIIDDAEKERCEEKIMDSLLVLRYVVSEYCWA